MFDVDLNQEILQILYHPRFAEQAENLMKLLPVEKLQDHFVVFSSGTTTHGLKGFALSKLALAKNANAVNNHFNLGSNERWGLSIPTYHVGGLSVLIRAEMGNHEIIDCRGWEPNTWTNKIRDEKVTITTVVPTQVFDLVVAKLKAPSNLRLMIVGGDFLSSELELQALNLGWPIIRTYGMSEVCSQLASARTPGDKNLEVLPIHKIKTEDSGRLLVNSQSLFTLQFNLAPEYQETWVEDLCDEDGFYKTQDRVVVDGQCIQPLGRLDDHFKQGGHLVDFLSLKDRFSTYLLAKDLYQKAEIATSTDIRLGKKIVILSENNSFTQSHLEEFQSQILPIKIDELRCVANFERTDLGKLKTSN